MTQRQKNAKSELKVKEEPVKVNLKNFKLSADVQNFYRFVYENKLRREANLMLSELLSKVKTKTKRKGRRKAKVQ